MKIKRKDNFGSLSAPWMYQSFEVKIRSATINWLTGTRLFFQSFDIRVLFFIYRLYINIHFISLFHFVCIHISNGYRPLFTSSQIKQTFSTRFSSVSFRNSFTFFHFFASNVDFMIDTFGKPRNYYATWKRNYLIENGHKRL